MHNFFLVAALTALVGCATHSPYFINPEGTITTCVSSSQGTFGLTSDPSAANACKDNLRKAGFIEVDSAGVIGIFFIFEKRDSAVKVRYIVAESPAELAGVEPNDVVLSIDGQMINDAKVATRLAFGVIDTVVILRVRRGSSSLEFRIQRTRYSAVFGLPKELQHS